MTRIAYADLAHGASGDMLIAAAVDAGRKLGAGVEDTVTRAVHSLDLGCSIDFLDDERGGLACLRAEVKTDGRTHTAGELRAAIERAGVPAAARDRALAALRVLVDAEAAVHGVAPEDVHLHELASADTAADLVGAAGALDALGVDAVWAAPVPVPRGWIIAAHGTLPLPAPVTTELLRGARVRGVDETSELVTPTGAAILAGHRTRYGPMPELVLAATGTGAGARHTDVPNICRIHVGETSEPATGAPTEAVVLLETNIDDQSPQAVAHAVRELLRRGALDAWITPIVMKKSRPAFALSVLTRPQDEAALVRTLFHETTTIGVRRSERTRWALEREELVVRVMDLAVRVKVARLDGEVVNIAPEFDDCVAASEATTTAVAEIRRLATDAARSVLAGH